MVVCYIIFGTLKLVQVATKVGKYFKITWLPSNNEVNTPKKKIYVIFISMPTKFLNKSKSKIVLSNLSLTIAPDTQFLFDFKLSR